MKRCLVLLLTLSLLFTLFGCQKAEGSAAEAVLDHEKIVEADVDLTKMSGTAVFGEVSDMLFAPEDYLGKVVRMTGTFNRIENPETGQVYYACLIADAAACCQQGLEFVLKEEGEPLRPGEEITVTGTFETYDEDGLLYCHLVDAVLDD